MAAGDWTPYANFLVAVGRGEVDLENDVFQMILLTDAYTPDIETDDNIDDLDTYELSGNGYSRQSIGTPTWSRSSATVSWTSGASAAFVATGGPFEDIKYAAIIDTSHVNTLPVCVVDLNDGSADPIADILSNTALVVIVPAGGYFTMTPPSL